MGKIEDNILWFIRKLRRASVPHTQSQQTDPDETMRNRYKLPTKWTPDEIPIKNEVLIRRLQEKLLSAKPSRRRKNHHNLGKDEKKAITELTNKPDIIIKPADKGSGTVIMDLCDYIDEANSQLSNEKHYKQVPSDPSPHIRANITRELKYLTLLGILKENMVKWLIPPTSTPARFYMLPKIHKRLIKPPGRPIMSANGHITERLSEYVDLHLKAHVPKIKSYIKDTQHLLGILKDTQVTSESIFVSFDVSALYTNIPHDEGISAINNFLTTHTNPSIARRISSLTKLVLENNNFTFNDNHYIQVSGTAMGTKMAPSYANIFMAEFEETHTPQAPCKPVFWKRFIDDILCIFHKNDDIDSYTTWLNTLHPTIKFTSERGTSISFLDTYLTIQESGEIRIRPYLKPTDTKQYLDPSSCHPPHNIQSIPYSQALRILRICNTQEDQDRELENLRGYFLNRKYEKWRVDKAFKLALKDYKQVKGTKKETGCTLIVPYNPNNPNYQQILNTVWNELGHEVNLVRPMVAYTRPKNLRDLLTKARLSTDTRPQPRLQPKAKGSYNKLEIKKPVYYVLFRCNNDHRHITDIYTNMEEAWEDISMNNITQLPFLQQHQRCGNITCMPTKAVTHITTKCTECNFTYRFTTGTTPTKFETEIRNAVDSMQRALFRQKWTQSPRCRNIGCDCCKHKSKKREINHNGTNFRTLPPDCKADSLVYFVECTKCNMLYVGQTQSTLQKRLAGHKSAAKNLTPYTMGTHFREPDHTIEDLKMGILDICKDKEGLNYREALWIHTLQTVDLGMNRRDERNLTLTIQTTHITNHFKHSTTCMPYVTSNIQQLDNL